MAESGVSPESGFALADVARVLDDDGACLLGSTGDCVPLPPPMLSFCEQQ